MAFKPHPLESLTSFPFFLAPVIPLPHFFFLSLKYTRRDLVLAGIYQQDDIQGFERNPFYKDDGSEPVSGGDSPVPFSELYQVICCARKPGSALGKVNSPPSRPEQLHSLLINDFSLAEASSVFTLDRQTLFSA